MIFVFQHPYLGDVSARREVVVADKIQRLGPRSCSGD